MIHTIIFDFGGVLGSNANFWTNDSEVLDKTQLSKKEIDDIYWHYWPDLRIGKSDLNIFFEHVARVSKLPVTIDELREIYHRKILINEDVITLVKELSEHYKLYVLANESKEGMLIKNKKFNLSSHFKDVFNSADLHLYKPQPEIYRTVLKEINELPENTIFIDDQEPYLNSAETLGISVIQFKDITRLRSDLSTLLGSH